MKIKAISLILIAMLLFSTTATGFAASNDTSNIPLQHTEDLEYGDIIYGYLVISEHSTISHSTLYPTIASGIVPFEQGTYWYYGGQRTFNEEYTYYTYDGRHPNWK